jgi:hypothetical protein
MAMVGGSLASLENTMSAQKIDTVEVTIYLKDTEPLHLYIDGPDYQVLLTDLGPEPSEFSRDGFGSYHCATGSQKQGTSMVYIRLDQIQAILAHV